MIAVTIAAARSSGSADLIVGLLLGAAIGFLVGPAVRSRLAYREWVDASRQADLTDELLTRMEQDQGTDADTASRSSDGVSPTSDDRQGADIGRRDQGSNPRTAWRTSR